MDEGGCVVVAQLLGEIQRLIDGHLVGHIVVVDDLPYRNT